MLSENDILFRDESLIAINKPCGLQVHRTSISEEEDEFALQQTRDLIGTRVYPVHRLDKPTSGVLIFALSPDIASAIQRMFVERKIKKIYTALVRGWFSEEPIHLNYPVKSSTGNLQDAETYFHLQEKFVFPFPVRPYATARYSVIEAIPATGRWHQIRQHLAHLRHYIINDRVHGDGHHNRLFTERLGIPNLFLHAGKLEFDHPVTGNRILLEAGFPEHWNQLKNIKTHESSYS